MSAISLLYEALAPREPPELPVPGRCCVLGTEELCVGREHAIKPSFTNLDLLRASDSEHVSIRAWRVLTHSVPAAEGKKRDTFPLMQSSWVVSNGVFQQLNRQAVRLLVIEGIHAPTWAAYTTTSYKKHGCLRAPVNSNAAQRWLFELDIVDCSDRAKVADWWKRLRTTREAGIPRPVIETLDCSVFLMSKHTALWREFEPWARGRLHAPLYRFLTYLLPSEEELQHARPAA
jgi:hypothetical protein